MYSSVAHSNAWRMVFCGWSRIHNPIFTPSSHLRKKSWFEIDLWSKKTCRLYFNRVTSDLGKLSCTNTSEKFFFISELWVLKVVHNWMIPLHLLWVSNIWKQINFTGRVRSSHRFFPKNSLNIFKDVKLEIMQKAMSQKNVLESRNKIATSTTVQNPRK